MHPMQDGVPYHSARTTMAPTSKHSVRSAVSWLSRCPDQNPIEHICDVVIRYGDQEIGVLEMLGNYSDLS